MRSPSRKNRPPPHRQDANFRTVVAAYELMRAKVTTAKASALKAQADADAAGGHRQQRAVRFRPRTGLAETKNDLAAGI